MACYKLKFSHRFVMLIIAGWFGWIGQVSAEHVEFDEYVVQYGAFTADTLPPQMASQYGLTRSNHLGILNVSVQKIMPEGLPQAVMAQVTAQAVNDAGQLKILQPRQVKEGEAIYYISEFRISHLERLKFTVNIHTAESNQPMEIKFNQTFFTR